MTKIRIGIIGATGYTGSELVRLLHLHPHVDIQVITSESKAGKSFSEVHKAFTGYYDMELQPLAKLNEYDIDLAFLALPHGVSMKFISENQNKNFKTIDLSGDFRLKSADVYKKWYGQDHIFPKAFENKVYGLPELYEKEIKDATLVANPGCYPTSSILSIYPLIKHDIITPEIIIDAKSGTTGAGISPKSITLFGNVNDNFKPYGLKSHRHTIEIEENLSINNQQPIIQFTPHLLPIDRGIIATGYSRPIKSISDQELNEIYEETYKNTPFVRIRKEPPAVKEVRGTNLCDVFVTHDERTNRIITVGAIDNLVKGASGQAIQNMNIMFDLPQDTGLQHLALIP
jgi:N-acetyl-gamma-glutamyl-phosphate reductase